MPNAARSLAGLEIVPSLRWLIAPDGTLLLLEGDAEHALPESAAAAEGTSIWDRLRDCDEALALIRGALSGVAGAAEGWAYGRRWHFEAWPVVKAGRVVSASGRSFLLDEPPGAPPAAVAEPCWTLDRDVPGIGAAGDAVVWTGSRFVHVNPIRPELLHLLPQHLLRQVYGPACPPPAAPRRERLLRLL